MVLNRVIGQYTGDEKGPLLIAVGGMHGNEPAGVNAIQIAFEMLEAEPAKNPGFRFKGKFIGLRGNLRALKSGKRFIDKDLNRQWTPANVDRILNSATENLDSEDLEMKEIIEVVADQIASYEPEKIVLIDLHTTTASGGIFSICTDDPESIRIAIELHAPVIKGMLYGMKGTTLHYFNSQNFKAETIAVCFESGQHDEELSVKRAIAALINCMRTIGCVKAKYVENRHDSLLIEYSKGLPQVAQLIATQRNNPDDGFRMMPNFNNFQKVKKGELLAKNKWGKIYAPEDGLILMPLYQNQGDDGFFLVKTIVAF